MDSHSDFINKINAAPQDVSRPIFQDLIAKGYSDGAWRTSPSAVDAKCISLDGERFQLQDLVSNLRHDASIFEKSHVGCHCAVECDGPEGKKVVTAYGLVS